MNTDPLADDLKNNRLNLMEQARALAALSPRRRSKHGLTLGEIAHRIGRSRIWVHRRLALLKFPKDIQQAAEEGLFTATDVEIVAGLPRAQWNRAARRILADKKLGKQTGRDDLKHKTTRQSGKKIKQMMDYLSGKGIEDLPLRLLAWCLGRVDDRQMHTEIKNSIGEDDDDSKENTPFSN